MEVRVRVSRQHTHPFTGRCDVDATDLGTAPTVASCEAPPRARLTPEVRCAILGPRYDAGMAAQGRIGQDWGGLGRLGKIPKRCKIGVAGSENHDKSQPGDTVRLHQVRFSNASAVAFPRARPPGVLSEDQVMTTKGRNGGGG